VKDADMQTLVLQCRWYELALLRHGYTVERLMHLARKVAADGTRRRGAALGDRFDDLVSRLQLAGMQAALRFDPTRQHNSYGMNGGDPFTSYASDIMDKRIDDFFRRRSEGFSDRRYGNFGVVTPTDEIEQQRAEVEDAIEHLDSTANVVWYSEAAEQEDMSLGAWIVRALNERASQSVTRPAARRARQNAVTRSGSYWPGHSVKVGT
jgi:hypothetical protein